MISLPKILRTLRMSNLAPISRTFGFDRGLPIDRYYIENFLLRNYNDIRGHVLEIGAPEYTRKFGGDKVTHSDVLHAVQGNPQATVVGDLATGEGLDDNKYDCIILTQTLPFIYKFKETISSSYAKMRDGGVLLATLPGISQVSRYDMDIWGDYWRFTDASARRLFGEVFHDQNVTVETFGNVLIACSFLHGLASHEFSIKELDYHDPDYQLIITIRAIKFRADVAN